MEITDCPVAMPGAHPQPRQPLGHRERARLEQPPKHHFLARHRAPGPPRPRVGWRVRRRAGARGWPPCRPSSGLRSQPPTTSATPSPHGARVAPHHAEAEEGGHDGQTQALAARDTKSSTAVSTPFPVAALAASPSADTAGRRGDTPGSSGVRPPRVADQRMAVGLRDLLGVEVVVPASVRPAHVVEQEQRQVRAARPLGDQPQLLGDRPVVVVAVDDHGVGQVEVWQRVRLVSRISSTSSRSRSSAHQRLLRRGVDRPATPPAVPGRPVGQQTVRSPA